MYIQNHLWNTNTPEDGYYLSLLVIHHYCSLNHQHSTFYIIYNKDLRKLERKKKISRHWRYSENYLITSLCGRNKAANEICAYLIIRRWHRWYA